MKFGQIIVNGSEVTVRTRRIVQKVDRWPLCVTFTLKRESPNCDATRRLVMIHVSMKFGQIIVSGSEVTVRTRIIVKKVDLWPLCVTFILKRESPNWDATRRLVMIHVCIKFGQIIFSGSEVTVRTRRIVPKVDRWPLCVTFTLKRETPIWDATRRLVMIHIYISIKCGQIIFSGSKVTVRTRTIVKKVDRWPLCDLHLESRDPKLGRDTLPCYDTRSYAITSNYL
jgi:hypothetical protein